jgi:hypothetical protein
MVAPRASITQASAAATKNLSVVVMATDDSFRLISLPPGHPRCVSNLNSFGVSERGITMTRYTTLRTWALVLKVAGFFMVVLTLFGVVVWAFEVDGFWQTIGVIFIGAPVAIFISTWGIALGQALFAIADIGDTVRPT